MRSLRCAVEPTGVPFERPQRADGLRESPHVVVPLVDGVALGDELACAVEVALAHRPDSQAVEEDCAPTIVAELLVQREAALVQTERRIVVAPDVGRTSPRPERLRS